MPDDMYVIRLHETRTRCDAFLALSQALALDGVTASWVIDFSSNSSINPPVTVDRTSCSDRCLVALLWTSLRGVPSSILLQIKSNDRDH